MEPTPWKQLNLQFPAFENKKYTAYENGPYGKIPTKIEETIRKFRFSAKQSFCFFP